MTCPELDICLSLLQGDTNKSQRGDKEPPKSLLPEGTRPEAEEEKMDCFQHFHFMMGPLPVWNWDFFFLG